MQNESIKNNLVLIAEDSPTQALRISKMLNALNYECVHMPNGKLALDYLRSLNGKNLPVVIISDIYMPEMDGYEFCRIVRKTYKEILFMMVTSYDDIDTLEKAYEAGAMDFITKPLLINEIKARLLNLIQTKKSEAIINQLLEDLRIQNQKLHELTINDDLTKTYNRRFIVDKIDYEILETQKSSSDLSVIMIDIDNFKTINDIYGHIYGDKVLYIIAQTLKNEIRASYIIARYGGEEFLVVLPDAAKAEAFAVAEKIRERISNIDFDFLKGSKRITVSCGLAQWEKDFTTTVLIDKADQKLYLAKQKGKNRTEF